MSNITEAKFRIVSSNHPHFDEVGHLDTSDYIGATKQMKLILDNCKHGTEACYVTEHEIVGA